MSDLQALFGYNCSTIFLLYPLGIERKKIVQLGFVQAFLVDAEKDVDYQSPVFLLFKPDSPTIFQAFIDSEYERVNKATGTVDIIEDYDYIDGYVVLVYQFPKEFEEDYNKFLEGKYSKFSKKFKDTFPKVVKIKTPEGRQMDEISTQYRIINRTADLKEYLEAMLGEGLFEGEMEFWSKPDMEKETLTFSKLKEKETKDG